MNRGVDRILSALRKQAVPWVLGYSGGKDSSAVLVLLLRALRSRGFSNFPIKIVYCDTGVEIPPAQRLAKEVLSFVEINHSDIVECCIAEPNLDDRFFVKVIGKGYVTPTNRFRWCTDKIRIRPVDRLISSFAFPKYEVLLGARLGESHARDKMLSKRTTPNDGYYKSANQGATRNFLPIFDYSVNDVWETIIENEAFMGVRASKLLGLYREAAGECPMVADPVVPPCGSARFGCWTCTVVSRDRTTESLVEHGYHSLAPLNAFRNWLSVVRDKEDWRWPNRRNGQPGLGPFTIFARRRVLARLQKAEIACGFQLIGANEVIRIRELWSCDRVLEKELC